MAAMPRKEPISSGRSVYAAFTVRELLGTPVFHQAKLLAGERGLSAVVRRLHTFNAPPDGSQVRAGDFVMMASPPPASEPERVRRLVADLFDRGAAGLGLRAATDDHALMELVRKEAELSGMALLELPEDLVLTEGSLDLGKEAGADEELRFEDLEKRYQALTRLLLAGGGLHGILDSLEAMLGNPVALVCKPDKLILSEGLRVSRNDDIKPLLTVLSERMRVDLEREGFVELIPDCRGYEIPIPIRMKNSAYLVLVECRRSIVALDQHSLQRLAPLIGMELMNAEAVSAIEGKYLEQFLQDWLSGKIVSEADWRLRSEVCGCALPDGVVYGAALVRLPEHHTTPNKLRELARSIRGEQLAAAPGLLAAPVGNELVLILPLPNKDTGLDGEPSALELMLTKLLPELQQRMRMTNLELYAGLPVRRPEQLSASLSQARRARQAADVCGFEREVVTYDKLGVYSLLYLIPSSEERDQFLRRFSIPLQLADRKGGGRLMETLDMFFRCNGNIKLTSERLYAHYNTVVYRLDKIQNILGMSLNDPEDRLQLQLSMKLAQITPSVT